MVIGVAGEGSANVTVLVRSGGHCSEATRSVDAAGATSCYARAMVPAVFLDRDGTLVHEVENAGDPDQVRLIRGADAVVASLGGLGYKVVVVTNQGGVARGLYTEQDVAAVHEKISELVQRNSNARIDRFYYCPYSPEGTIESYRRDHPWRKPQPGMLLQAAEDLDIDLSQSWMIGDNVFDTQAGRAAGVRTILLRPEFSNVQHATAEQQTQWHCDYVAPTLIEAVKAVVQQRKPEAYEQMRDAAPAGEPEPPRPAPPAARPTPSQEPAAAAVAQPSPPKPAPAQSAKRQAPAPPSGPAPSDANTDLLRQLLTELRRKPQAPGRMTYCRAFALILQFVTAVCLLGALFVGRTEPDAFLRWLGCAILLQLATIAALLFDRR